MAGRLLVASCKALRVPKVPSGAMAMSHGSGAPHPTAVAGNRDVVGYGFNGRAIYYDRPDFPLPAVRWAENSADVLALREKEKGDWSKLSIAEKKALYRASFRQTFSEFQAGSGEWKQILGLSLMFISAGIWLYYGAQAFVYAPLPPTFEESRRKAQLRRMLDLQVNPIEGISSKWDYEKDDWKK